MHKFIIGEIVKSTRSWCDLVISEIHAGDGYLTGIDGRSIKFSEAHVTGRHYFDSLVTFIKDEAEGTEDKQNIAVWQSLLHYDTIYRTLGPLYAEMWAGLSQRELGYRPRRLEADRAHPPTAELGERIVDALRRVLVGKLAEPETPPSEQAERFLVTWKIDSDADNAQAAAREAWAAMQRDGTSANVFEVTDKRTGETVLIDLEEEG